jgi:hypothetical protein
MENESAWSYEACMHDMEIMMQCNLFKLNGIGISTHTYMVQVVLLHDILNIDWHGKDKAWVSYTKLNEVVKP